MIDHYAVMGPTPCIGCRRSVLWERVGGRWALYEIVGEMLWQHACKPRCFARMRGQLICERTVGHGGDHSSRSSLDRLAAYMRGRYAKRASAAVSGAL